VTANHLVSCQGCAISQGHSRTPGGIVVPLENDWIVSHYGGGEGFLGWLALSTRYHRMEIPELTHQEAAALGPNIQRVDNALKAYWSKEFEFDPIERMYTLYLMEGTFDTPYPSPYHLHIHIIPRPRKLGALLREDMMFGGTTINAWKIPFLYKRHDFPSEYRRTEDTARKLMEFLREHI